jgi:hypothetical protein
MTQEEFNNTSFGKGDKVRYKGSEYDILELNFEENLIGIFYWDSDPVTWVTCESCTYIPYTN